MIKIVKGNPPNILINKAGSWKQDLLNAIDNYGKYKTIPPDKKKFLLSHYRCDEIKTALSDSSYGKCAFCESRPETSGNLEVEHFVPKSLYPEQTFEWDNLLPICRNCNQAKSDHDTMKDPILNPSKTDPERALSYKLIRICPHDGSTSEEIACRTIEVCNLNRYELCNARAHLLTSFTKYMEDLKAAINDIKGCINNRQQHTKLLKLRDSLDMIDSLLTDDSLYAGYCRWLVKNEFPEYLEAKNLLSQKQTE